MRVAIRVDASTAIGTGHVFRCLTLASDLRATGADVLFICREHDGNLCDQVVERGFAVHRLPASVLPAGSDHLAHAAWLGAGWQEDAAQTAFAISSQFARVEWLVVDHYALDVRWETALRPLTANLMVIDDLADRPHDCDVLLDQNLHRDLALRYDGLIPSNSQRLLGPRFALLQPEFRSARGQLPTRDGNVRRLLISFGGVDVPGATVKALRSLARVEAALPDTDVMVGAANPHLREVRELCRERSRTVLHVAPRHGAELMAAADLAIGAAGASSWERCCLGLPAIVISLASNQQSIARALGDGGLAVYLGPCADVTEDMLATALQQLMHEPDRVQAMGRACREVTDGNGAQRVVRALDPTPIR